jgi:Tol biopolymer transport system component
LGMAQYAQYALTTVEKLNDAVMSLHEAVLASKRNDGIMQEIARRIRHRAPIIMLLLEEKVHSDRPEIHQAFCDTLESVVAEMDRARLVVYKWLVKGKMARLASAGDMEQALKEARHVMDRGLEDVQALVQYDTRDGVKALQQGAQQLQQRMGAYGAQVEAVAQQLGRLLDRSDSDPAQTLRMARFALDLARKGYVKLKGHTGWVVCVAWSPDGSQLATASGRDRAAAMWDAANGQQLRVLEGHTGNVNCVAWSPDGGQLATASYDTTAALWDAATGQRLRALEGHAGYVNCVAWSPDGSKLATASADNTAALWDAATGWRLHALEGHTFAVNCVAWSPYSTHVATASDDNTVALWGAATGQLLRRLQGHASTVFCVAWSPDGAKLATASGDRTAALWDAGTGWRLCTLEGHRGTVRCVAWSPDGSKLATASDDKTAALWDAATGQRLRKLEGHRDWVRCVAWSPDCSRVATASDDKSAAVWKVDVADLEAAD